MKEFILAALPFVIIGICLAVMCVNHQKNKESDNAGNYLTEGMCLGMCMGISAATSLHFNLGLGISLGVLAGETIGMMKKKN